MHWRIAKAVVLVLLFGSGRAGAQEPDDVSADLYAWEQVRIRQQALLERRQQEGLLELGDKFKKSLEGLKEDLRSRRDLDGLLDLEVFLREFVPGEPLPRTPDLEKHAGFQSRLARWEEVYNSWEIEIAREQVAQMDLFLEMLSAQEKNRTRMDEIDAAMEIREERRRWESDEGLRTLREQAASLSPGGASSLTKGLSTANPGQPVLVTYEQSIVLNYTFDRDERWKVSDTSRGRNHGKTENTEWLPQGRKGGALRFDGRSSRVVVEDAESLHLTGPLTMAFWVYPEKQTREVGRIVFKAAGGEFGVELKQDGTLMFGHGSTGAVQQPGQQVNCSKKLPHEVWTHVCIVRDPGSKSIVWYINGREVERVALTVNPAASTGRPLILGGGRKRNPSESWQPPDAFQGILDELVMLKTVLSGKEIAWLYQEVGGTQ